MSSARSALESSASRLESVTASAVSLSALTGTSAQKGSPVKLKVASPRPNRWPKHSTTAPKSLHGEGRTSEDLCNLCVVFYCQYAMSVVLHSRQVVLLCVCRPIIV